MSNLYPNLLSAFGDDVVEEFGHISRTLAKSGAVHHEDDAAKARAVLEFKFINTYTIRSTLYIELMSFTFTVHQGQEKS